MRIIPRLSFFLFIAAGIVFYRVLPAYSLEESRYGNWQTSDDRLENMINDLERIIDEGTKSRAAHPGFLQDLNMIIEQYRTPQKKIYFADDFADNNYSENPAWQVSKGSFTIDSFGGLYSSIAVRKPSVETKDEPEPEGDRNLRILFGVLNELTKDQNDTQENEESGDSLAVIISKSSIPNSFTMEYTFRSNANWGSTSIGVIQGDDPFSGYHIVYQASPAENRPMQLIKYRNGKPYTIDEVYENSPNLDDGTDHTARLSRSQNGDMIIIIDNIEIMRSSDLSYRDDFTGIVILNNGGSYSYDNIEIFTEE